MNKDLILYFVIFIIILFIILLPKIKDRKNNKKNNKDKPKQKNQYKTVLIISILIGLMLLYFDAKLGVIVLFLSVIMYYENSNKRDETEENYQEFLGASGRAKTESLTNELKVKNIINSLVKNVKGNFRKLQGQLKIQKKLIEESKNSFETTLKNAVNECSPTSTFSDTVGIDTQSGFTDFNMPNPLKESFVKSGVPNIRDLIMSEYIGEEELDKDILPDNKFQKQGPALNSEYLNSNIDKTGTVFYPLN